MCALAVSWVSTVVVYLSQKLNSLLLNFDSLNQIKGNIHIKRLRTLSLGEGGRVCAARSQF